MTLHKCCNLALDPWELVLNNMVAQLGDFEGYFSTQFYDDVKI